MFRNSKFDENIFQWTGNNFKELKDFVRDVKSVKRMRFEDDPMFMYLQIDTDNRIYTVDVNDFILKYDNKIYVYKTDMVREALDVLKKLEELK